MHDTRKGEKFFLEWYDGVSDEEGVARVLWGEVEVWILRFSRSKTEYKSKGLPPAIIHDQLGFTVFRNFTTSRRRIATCLPAWIS
jgi:hypothetical protein